MTDDAPSLSEKLIQENLIQDMWIPLPVTPQRLKGIENLVVAVECENTVAEQLFGQAECERLQKKFVETLRMVGIEGDPERMKGGPANSFFMIMIHMEEKDEFACFSVFASVVVGNVAVSEAAAPNQEELGWIGYSRRLDFPWRIAKGPGVSTSCFSLALFLIGDFMDTFLENNPDRQDNRDEGWRW